MIMHVLGWIAIGTLFLLAFIIGLVLYFLPTLVAAKREHPNGLAIFVVNLFLGWLLVGWVVALAWACTGETRARPARARSGQPWYGTWPESDPLARQPATPSSPELDALIDEALTTPQPRS
jgi:hypothetical protein